MTNDPDDCADDRTILRRAARLNFELVTHDDHARPWWWHRDEVAWPSFDCRARAVDWMRTWLRLESAID
jgi:hypothetical protein